MAYRQDLRERVLDFVESGGGKEEAAERYGVARSTVYLWCKTPQKRKAAKTGPKKAWKLNLSLLQERINAKPDSYQHELAKALGVTQPRICQSLKKLRLSRKKNDALPGEKRRLSQVLS